MFSFVGILGMKKVYKIICCLLIVGIISCIFIHFYTIGKTKKHNKEIKMEVAYSNNVQVYDAIVDNIILDEKSNIKIDEKFKETIENDVKTLAKNYSANWDNGVFEEFRFYDLCEKLNIKQRAITIDHIMSFKDKDSGAFYRDLYCRNNKNENKEEMIEDTLLIAEYLYKYVDQNEYDMVSQAVNWYNEYIDKADFSDEENINTSIVIFAEYFLEKTDNLDKINLEKMKTYILSNADESNYDKTYKDVKISQIDSLADDNYYLSYFGEETINLDTKKMYLSLKTEDDFEIDTENSDEITISFINDGRSTSTSSV